MPYWSIGFLIAALLEAVIGFADPASDIAEPARALCVAFFAMALYSLTRTRGKQDRQDGWLHPS